MRPRGAEGCSGVTGRRVAYRSSCGELHGEAFVASNHEAVDPTGRIVGVETDAFGSFEEQGQDDARFHPCEWRSDAVVHAAAETDVMARRRSLEIDLVGMFEFDGVAVGSTPEQEDRRLGGNRYSTEGGVLGYGSHVEPERRFEP